jgi:hypothetical protein
MLRTAASGKHAPVRPHHALAVGVGGGLGIDVQRDRARAPGTARGVAAERRLEHLVEVRGRVGADQQHAPPAVGERDGRRAGDAGLADAALAGEEEVARGVAVEEFHELTRLSSSPPDVLVAAWCRSTGHGDVEDVDPFDHDAGQRGQRLARGVRPRRRCGRRRAPAAAPRCRALRASSRRASRRRRRAAGTGCSARPHALLREPLDVRGEAGELGVDARAADAGGAAQGGIEDFQGGGTWTFLSSRS